MPNNTEYYGWNELLDNLSQILFKPFFSLFGEIFLKDRTNYGHEFPERCIEPIAHAELAHGAVLCPERNTWSTILTGLYMFGTNLILLNILIAIFTD